jgi:two-component sensor histidine kinase
MPTLPVVVTLAIVTAFVGIWCGITTALVGGILSWYLFFNPYSWSIAHGAFIPLISFAVIATVIVTTAHLYRSSERRRHDAELRRLQIQADNADLFAREMAHRLKNALAIVQSIAFQTIGSDSVEAGKFASRLKALAEANELLSEDVHSPTAEIGDVIHAALKPFSDEGHRFVIGQVEARIRSQQVISLALAIHELATNAVKYGALSVPRGTVRIDFELLTGRLIMTWIERGGPPVDTPGEQGFGMRLLRRSGMNAQVEFLPEGLGCSIEVSTV